MTIRISNAQKLSSLAGGLGLVLTTAAQAGIIYTDIPDWISDFSGVNGNNTQGFDIDGDLVDDFTIRHTVGSNWYDYATAGITGTNSTNQVVADTASWYQSAIALNSGDSINTASNFYIGRDENLGSVYYGRGNVIGAGDTYVGFKFDIAGDTKYGWMGLNFSSDGKKVSIYDYAYEDSGLGIAAGNKGISVPEPSSMAMMATGALAIAAIRRRKRKQKLN